jgi:hypothetical protein
VREGGRQGLAGWLSSCRTGRALRRRYRAVTPTAAACSRTCATCQATVIDVARKSVRAPRPEPSSTEHLAWDANTARIDLSEEGGRG